MDCRLSGMHHAWPTRAPGAIRTELGSSSPWFGHGLAGLACHCQVVNLVRLGNVLPPQPFRQEALLLAFRKPPPEALVRVT